MDDLTPERLAEWRKEATYNAAFEEDEGHTDSDSHRLIVALDALDACGKGLTGLSAAFAAEKARADKAEQERDRWEQNHRDAAKAGDRWKKKYRALEAGINALADELEVNDCTCECCRDDQSAAQVRALIEKGIQS